MKILMLSQMVPYLPCYDGFRVCPANLLRALSRRHEIHLIARRGSESPAELSWSAAYCASTRFESTDANTGAPPEEILAAVLSLRPDICHMEGPMLAPLGPLLRPHVPVVLSIHDSMTLRHRDFARCLPTKSARFKSACQAILAGRYERRWYGSADCVVVFSDEDRDALRGAVLPERVVVAPYGIDTQYWAFDPRPVQGRLIFTGNMAWPPNVEAAVHFATRVFPLVRSQRPEAQFCITGADPSERVLALRQFPGVRVIGSVPDMREHLSQAAVYVSPLHFGAGVKNKLLEAMAVGVPIVATSRSLTGSSAIAGRHLLVADHATEFAAAVIDLLGNPSRCDYLARAARQYVERDCSWEAAAGIYETRYKQISDQAIRSVVV